MSLAQLSNSAEVVELLQAAIAEDREPPQLRP